MLTAKTDKQHDSWLESDIVSERHTLHSCANFDNAISNLLRDSYTAVLVSVMPMVLVPNRFRRVALVGAAGVVQNEREDSTKLIPKTVRAQSPDGDRTSRRRLCPWSGTPRSVVNLRKASDSLTDNNVVSCLCI